MKSRFCTSAEMEPVSRLLVIYCSLTLLTLKGLCHSIVDPNVDPFDGGPLSSCQRPSFSDDDLCKDVVDYEVPSSLAKLVQIIQNRIRYSVSDLTGETEQCTDNYRKLLCLHRFPACENDQVVLEQRNQNLDSEIRRNCTNLISRTRNRTEETRLPLVETCRPISDFTESSNITFSRCRIDEGMLVTRWMAEYLEMVDQTIRNEEGYLFRDDFAMCRDAFSSELCSFIGRCTAYGRVEYVNTYESCSDAINCYNHDIQDALSQQINCEEWPLSSERRTVIDPRPTGSKTSSDLLPTHTKIVDSVLEEIKKNTDDTGTFDTAISSGLSFVVSLVSLITGVLTFYALT